ncbi:MAG: hypothetical protein PHG06_20645 [Parabacteroides sp.]|nr:hypothetical protein [Parabacteroides sp.]
MNKRDRKELEKALELLNSASEIITMIKEQEEEKYDNLPEGIQNSERGEKFQEGIDNLDYAISDLETAVEFLNEAINQ